MIVHAHIGMQPEETWVFVNTELPICHGITTPELMRLANWLKEQGVETIAMESTGV